MQTLHEWAEAIRIGDVETLASLVTEDAEFWTHGAPPTKGRAALAAAFRALFAGYSMDQQFAIDERIECGEWLFLRGMETNTLTNRKDGTRVEIRQRAFSLLHHDRDGRWRFARGMTNQPPDAITPAKTPPR